MDTYFNHSLDANSAAPLNPFENAICIWDAIVPPESYPDIVGGVFSTFHSSTYNNDPWRQFHLMHNEN